MISTDVIDGNQEVSQWRHCCHFLQC